MQQSLSINGITCAACEYKIKYLFENIPHVERVEVDLKTGETQIFSSQSIDTQQFEEILKPYPKYSLQKPENLHIATRIPHTENSQSKTQSWAQTYKPILLIFSYIAGISILLAFQNGGFDFMLFMRVFMAAFFLLFSFFKLLDLRGFAESYQMYDIIAKKIPIWGLLYPFVELFLGLAYLLDFQPFMTNLFCLIIMSVSLLGVLLAVFNKNKIRCACLGSVFNLPMSTITIIEDGLMIIMAFFMLIL